MSKFKVVVGKDWSIEAEVESENGEPIKLINALAELKIIDQKVKEVVSRHFLAGFIVTILALALLLATIWGWQQNNFSGVQQVWAASSVPLGWILGYYFKKNGDRS